MDLQVRKSQGKYGSPVWLLSTQPEDVMKRELGEKYQCKPYHDYQESGSVFKNSRKLSGKW